MAITKTQRWLDLIAFLVKHHFPVDVEQIMLGVPAYREKWLPGDERRRATVRRMFERDKDELREAGIPIETVQYSIEHGAEQAIGYRLSSRDFYLPYLRIVSEERRAGRDPTSPAASAAGGAAGRAGPSTGMEVPITPDEAALAMDALRRVAELPDSPFAAEARSALAKLRFDLEPPAPSGEAAAGRPDEDAMVDAVPAARYRALEAAPLLYAEALGAGGVAGVVRLLTDALHRRKRVRFRYHGIHRGRPTDRDVAPYGLLYQHGHWYLIGEDATRNAIRVFRVGRMEAPAVGEGGAAEYEIPADFDVSAYAHRQPWELGEDEPLGADVRFEFPLSLWAERNGQGRAVEELAGGAVVRRFEVRQTDPFLRWLQSFAGDAIVVGPPELRRAQAALARETLEAHGG